MDFYLTPYKKFNQYHKYKSSKFKTSEENIEVNFYGLGFVNEFLDLTSKIRNQGKNR